MKYLCTTAHNGRFGELIVGEYYEVGPPPLGKARPVVNLDEAVALGLLRAPTERALEAPEVPQDETPTEVVEAAEDGLKRLSEDTVIRAGKIVETARKSPVVAVKRGVK